ncbi:hypothetical protein Tcan_06738 [Toxocara canis]|uniref:Uncharacterized protein n=1 Tax=Toxocara canis TaxID=6265 RepID=A0A0B2VUJ6_TOXCA|nr:hypothetical protein Tcan_06738 [Toxocara canis]
MPFEKIGDPAKTVLQDMEAYHYSALLSDRFWIFSRKYKEQPHHNWGHRICFSGGYSAYFDIASKQWSSKEDFAAISNEENLEEALFVFNSHIFLLLYTGFGGIKFQNLFRWDFGERNWSKISDFQVEPSNNLVVQEANTHSALIVVRQEQGVKDSIHLVSVVGDVIRVHKLSVDDRHASLSLVHGVSLSNKLGLYTPIMAARWGDDIYMIGGVHGCGFHFEPKKWIWFDLKTKTSEVIEITDDAPPFRFSGSSYVKVLPNGLWVHATGSVQRGMTNSVFNGEIWTVNLKSKPLKWKKCGIVVPETDREELVIAISDAGMVYVADNHRGIFAANLE